MMRTGLAGYSIAGDVTDVARRNAPSELKIQTFAEARIVSSRVVSSICSKANDVDAVITSVQLFGICNFIDLVNVWSCGMSNTSR